MKSTRPKKQSARAKIFYDFVDQYYSDSKSLDSFYTSSDVRPMDLKKLRKKISDKEAAIDMLAESATMDPAKLAADGSKIRAKLAEGISKKINFEKLTHTQLQHLSPEDQAYVNQVNRDHKKIKQLKKHLSKGAILCADDNQRRKNIVMIMQLYDYLVGETIDYFTKMMGPDSNMRAIDGMKNYLFTVLELNPSSAVNKDSVAQFYDYLTLIYGRQKIKGAKSPLKFSDNLLDEVDAYAKEKMLSKSGVRVPVFADRQISDVEYLAKVGVDIILDKLASIQKKYTDSMRTSHTKDIKKLIEEVKKVQASTADPELAFKRALSIVEKALMQEQKHFTKTFMCFGGRSENDFIKKVNEAKRRYFYPHLLSKVLRDVYESSPYIRIDGDKHQLSKASAVKMVAYKISPDHKTAPSKAAPKVIKLKH